MGWSGPLARLLVDGPVGQGAVPAHHLVAGGPDLPGQRGGHLAGQLEVVGPVPPGAVDARAPLHEVAGDPGQLQQVPALQADVLGLQVAGHVVGDALGDGPGGDPGELEVQAGAVAPVERQEVLGGVEGVLGHQVGLGRAQVEGVVALHHVGAGRLGHHDVASGPHLRGQDGHVVPGRPLEGLDVARVQPGRPAAAGSLGQRAVDPVALEDPDQVTADARVHVLDEAGGEDGHPVRVRPRRGRRRAEDDGRTRWRSAGGRRGGGPAGRPRPPSSP